MAEHWTEDDLVLYFYGEGRRREEIERHLQSCTSCAASYRAIAVTLGSIPTPAVPERGDQYGLEVWQRIRPDLAEPQTPWWMLWIQPQRLTMMAAAAVLLIAAFVAGRVWEHQPAQKEVAAVTPASPGVDNAGRKRILLTSVADHLDQSERVLTDIVNTSGGDITAEQSWAEDLLTTSRLYRQDAADAGEQSIANVLDELERSLLEIVHSPSRASAADLDNIRRRIDAAALLFKVRILSDELRQRDDVTAGHAVERSAVRKTS
ncbi:MAG TPA: hypothetical protein VEU08_05470 [Vicinamibacterales bacterium]|nr:hypothetical protein [Vicinamibacterales bacterium]